MLSTFCLPLLRGLVWISLKACRGIYSGNLACAWKEELHSAHWAQSVPVVVGLAYLL